MTEPILDVVVPFLVVHPCVTVRGMFGSQGVFYADDYVTTWANANGDEDFASTSELRRLSGLGAITVLPGDQTRGGDADVVSVTQAATDGQAASGQGVPASPPTSKRRR